MAKTNYFVNFGKQAVVVTKEFAKKASVPGTNEYKVLTSLLKDYAGFTVEVKTIRKKEDKKSYSGLSFPVMRDYIRKINAPAENADEEAKKVASKKMKAELDALEKIITLSDKHYGVVKKWFLDKYEYTSELDEMLEEAAKQKADRDAAKAADDNGGFEDDMDASEAEDASEAA